MFVISFFLCVCVVVVVSASQCNRLRHLFLSLIQPASDTIADFVAVIKSKLEYCLLNVRFPSRPSGAQVLRWLAGWFGVRDSNYHTSLFIIFKPNVVY